MQDYHCRRFHFDILIYLTLAKNSCQIARHGEDSVQDKKYWLLSGL